MWSARNPFYLSATRFLRPSGREEEEKKKKREDEEEEKKNLQVQAWRGEDEYHRRILATKGAQEQLVCFTTESEAGMCV